MSDRLPSWASRPLRTYPLASLAVVLMLAAGGVGLAVVGVNPARVGSNGPTTSSTVPTTPSAAYGLSTLPAFQHWLVGYAQAWGLDTSGLSKLSTAQWLSVQRVAADMANGNSADLKPALSLLLFGAGLVFTVEGATVLAACAASAGVVCAVIIAAVAVTLAVALIYGVQSTQDIGSSAAAWSRASAVSLRNLALIQANATRNLVNAIQADRVAFQYEAAAAALTQLPNSTFNAGLDLYQSSIASQLQTVAMSDELTLTSVITEVTNYYMSIFGATGTFGSQGVSCQLTAGVGSGMLSFIADGTTSSTLTFPEDISGWSNAGSSACDQSGGGSVTDAMLDGIAFPGFMPTTTIATHTTLWIQNGTPYIPWAIGACGVTLTGTEVDTIHLVPTDGSTHFQNLSGPRGVEKFYRGPSGVYSVNMSRFGSGGGSCSGSTSNGGWVFEMALPLDQPSAKQVQEAYFFNGTFTHYDGSVADTSPSTMPFMPNDTFTAECGHNSVACSTFAFGSGGVSSVIYDKLWDVESVGQTSGFAYWSLLKTLGFNSVSAVPANCLVPTVSDALPPTLSFATLVNLSVNATEALYVSYFETLGHDFNSTFNLSGGAFCGKHLHVSVPTFAWGDFGTWGVGDVYQPCSHGCGTETITNNATWNFTHVEIFVAPSTHSIRVPTNVTWEAPSANPITSYVNQNYSTNKSTLIILCPTACVGNSSNLSGSVYPTATASTPPGWAFHLSACYGTTSKGVSFRTNVCSFNYSSIESVGSNLTGCDSPTCANGQGGGGAGVGTACSTLPLLGPIINGVANVVSAVPLVGGSLGCLIGDAVAFVIGFVLLILVVWVVAAVVRRD